MKKILLILLFLSSLVFSASMTSAACGDPATQDPKSFLTGCSSDSNPVGSSFTEGKEWVRSLVQTVAARVLQFGALFAIGALVFSGIRYTTSAGDDEKLKSAKNTAIYAIIGLVLLLAAFPLVDIVVRFIYWLWTQQ